MNLIISALYLYLINKFRYTSSNLDFLLDEADDPDAVGEDAQEGEHRERREGEEGGEGRKRKISILESAEKAFLEDPSIFHFLSETKKRKLISRGTGRLRVLRVKGRKLRVARKTRNFHTKMCEFTRKNSCKKPVNVFTGLYV